MIVLGSGSERINEGVGTARPRTSYERIENAGEKHAGAESLWSATYCPIPVHNILFYARTNLVTASLWMALINRDGRAQRGSWLVLAEENEALQSENRILTIWLQKGNASEET